jgi:hypothetical protein
VIENIMLPMDFCGSFPMGKRQKRALPAFRASALTVKDTLAYE